MSLDYFSTFVRQEVKDAGNPRFKVTNALIFFQRNESSPSKLKAGTDGSRMGFNMSEGAAPCDARAAGFSEKRLPEWPASRNILHLLDLFRGSSGCGVCDGPGSLFPGAELGLLQDLNQHWKNIGIYYGLRGQKRKRTLRAPPGTAASCLPVPPMAHPTLPAAAPDQNLLMTQLQILGFFKGFRAAELLLPIDLLPSCNGSKGLPHHIQPPRQPPNSTLRPATSSAHPSFEH